MIMVSCTLVLYVSLCIVCWFICVVIKIKKLLKKAQGCFTENFPELSRRPPCSWPQQYWKIGLRGPRVFLRKCSKTGSQSLGDCWRFSNSDLEAPGCFGKNDLKLSQRPPTADPRNTEKSASEALGCSLENVQNCLSGRRVATRTSHNLLQMPQAASQKILKNYVRGPPWMMPAGSKILS